MRLLSMSGALPTQAVGFFLLSDALHAPANSCVPM